MPFLLDTFTAPDGTQVTDRPADIGGTYALSGNVSPFIIGDKCTLNGNGFIVNSVVPPSDDYEVSAPFYGFGSGSGSNIGFWIRSSDTPGPDQTPTGYTCVMTEGGCYVQVFDPYPTGTSLAGPFDGVDGDVFTLRVEGTTLTLLQNGVVVWSDTDTTVASGGSVGIGTGWDGSNPLVMGTLRATTLDIQPFGFLDERFGGGNVITTIGALDEVFGTSGFIPPVKPTGALDEQFGTCVLRPTIDPTGVADESFGVSQVISGDLSMFYGPLPTPLLVDAPYTKVYEGLPPDSLSEPVTITDGMARTAAGLLVPKFNVYRASPQDTPPNQGGSRYRFVITDMMGGVVGEVQEASQKTITQVLDNIATGAFTVKTSNPIAEYILNHPCLCKCYRQPVNRNYAYRLMLTGDVTTDEEDTDDQSGALTFTVADPLNRLLLRLIGKGLDSSNHGTGFTAGGIDALEDIADVIGAMLLDVNSDSDLKHCGVTLGIRGPNTPHTYMEAVYFTPFATQLALYTDTLDGVDFQLEAQEPYSLAEYPPTPGSNPYLTGGPPSDLPPQRIVTGTSVADTIIAKLNVFFPMGNFLQHEGPPGVYSKNRPYPVFEFGMGKHNVASYQRIRDRSQLTNRWWNLPDGFPDSNSSEDPLVKSLSTVKNADGLTAAESIDKYGGWEQIDSGDLGTGVTDLRQKLVNAESATTSTPRQQITFVPVINADTDWTIDYFLGDIATIRAYVAEANNGQGSMRFNGTLRLYGISGQMDDNEQEQISITTIPPNGSSISAPGG
jgi:hypothetical protein